MIPYPPEYPSKSPCLLAPPPPFLVHDPFQFSAIDDLLPDQDVGQGINLLPVGIHQLAGPFGGLVNSDADLMLHHLPEKLGVDVVGQGIGMDKTQFLIHPQVGNSEVGLRRLLKVAGLPGIHVLGAEIFNCLVKGQADCTGKVWLFRISENGLTTGQKSPTI